MAIATIPTIQRKVVIPDLDCISAILAGTATRNQKRTHADKCMEFQVRDQIGDAVRDIGDKFEEERIEVVLEDDEVGGWYLNRTSLFSGTAGQVEWSAKLVQHVRNGRTLHLTFDVSTD